MARKPACVEDKSILSLVEAEREGWGNYSQLYRLVMNGTLPAFRVGKTLRVKREDLERFEQDVANDPDMTYERMSYLLSRYRDMFSEQQRESLIAILDDSSDKNTILYGAQQIEALEEKWRSSK